MATFDVYSIITLICQVCFIATLTFFAIKTESIGLIIIIISSITSKIIHMIITYLMKPVIPLAFDLIAIPHLIAIIIQYVITSLSVCFNTFGLLICYLEWKNGKFQFNK